MDTCKHCSGDGITELAHLDSFYRVESVEPVLCPVCNGENGTKTCVVIGCQYAETQGGMECTHCGDTVSKCDIYGHLFEDLSIDGLLWFCSRCNESKLNLDESKEVEPF